MPEFILSDPVAFFVGDRNSAFSNSSGLAPISVKGQYILLCYIALIDIPRFDCAIAQPWWYTFHVRISTWCGFDCIEDILCSLNSGMSKSDFDFFVNLCEAMPSFSIEANLTALPVATSALVHA